MELVPSREAASCAVPSILLPCTLSHINEVVTLLQVCFTTKKLYIICTLLIIKYIICRIPYVYLLAVGSHGCYNVCNFFFHFVVLHPVARALSRLSGKNRPSQQLFKSQSQSHITTDNQSASPSWCQAPIWDPRPIFLSPRDFLLDSYYLLLYSALSDERTGL
jgi:hypothetical protein